jgi:hypothetical protein
MGFEVVHGAKIARSVCLILTFAMRCGLLL